MSDSRLLCLFFGPFVLMSFSYLSGIARKGRDGVNRVSYTTVCRLGERGVVLVLFF